MSFRSTRHLGRSEECCRCSATIHLCLELARSLRVSGQNGVFQDRVCCDCVEETPVAIQMPLRCVGGNGGEGALSLGMGLNLSDVLDLLCHLVALIRTIASLRAARAVRWVQVFAGQDAS